MKELIMLERQLHKNILMLILEGKTIKEISDTLRFSPSAISYHIQKLHKTFNSKNRTELIINVLTQIINVQNSMIFELQQEKTK